MIKDKRKLKNDKRQLRNVSLVGNVDFGHMANMVTLPAGGTVKLDVHSSNKVKVKIKIIKHQ